MNDQPTTGEILVEKFSKIHQTLEEIKNKGIPRSLLVVYVKERTRLPKKTVEAVLEAIEEFKKEFR